MNPRTDEWRAIHETPPCGVNVNQEGQSSKTGKPLHLQKDSDWRYRWARGEKGRRCLTVIAEKHGVTNSYVSQVLHGKKFGGKAPLISEDLDLAILISERKAAA